jgi:hypothetical protein
MDTATIGLWEVAQEGIERVKRCIVQVVSRWPRLFCALRIPSEKMSFASLPDECADNH